jgi:hypothetical protein
MKQVDVCNLVLGSEGNSFQVSLPELPSLIRGNVDVCSIRHVLARNVDVVASA